MEYLKQLKNAALFGGLMALISLLGTLGVDFYGLLGAFFSFLILAVHDAGKKYMERTNQSAAVRHLFGMIVNPLLAIICVSSLFYVLAGAMSWFFWLVALFFALILFLLDAVPLLETMKKS